MAEIKVLIVEDSEQMRESLRRTILLEDDMTVVGEAGDGATAIELAREHEPAVVLMDINMPELDGISATAEIVRDLNTRVVIISVEGEHEYFRRAMQAGACDFLVKPFTASDVISAVRRAHRQYIDSQVAADDGGHVVTVYGGKGGVGKSTLAANLGVVLARSCETPVLVIDLDLEFGDQMQMFSADTSDDLGTLWAYQQSITPELVVRGAKNVAQGVDLLASPVCPERLSEIMAGIDSGDQFVDKLIEVARERYKFIVVDTACNYRPETMSALDHADTVMLVTTQEVTSLHSTAKILSTLVDKLEFDRDRLRVVVNRYERRTAVDIHDMAQGLGHDVFATIPCDWKACLWAANVGSPLLNHRRKSEVSRAIGKLAEQLVQTNDNAVRAAG